MTPDSRAIVTFLYPTKGMTHFDMDYYLKQHVPMTKALWGPLGMSDCIPCGITDENKEGSGFAVKVITFWENLKSWDTAKMGKAAKELAADLDKFTNVRPVTVVGQVLN
jgi:uncharacterized protein (TIGR02118 family)